MLRVLGTRVFEWPLQIVQWHTYTLTVHFDHTSSHARVRSCYINTAAPSDFFLSVPSVLFTVGEATQINGSHLSLQMKEFEWMWRPGSHGNSLVIEGIKHWPRRSPSWSMSTNRWPRPYISNVRSGVASGHFLNRHSLVTWRRSIEPLPSSFPHAPTAFPDPKYPGKPKGLR